MEQTFEEIYEESGEISLVHFPVRPINLFVDGIQSPLDVYGTGFGPWRVARTVEAAEAVLALGRVRTLSVGCETLLEWIAEHEHWHNIEQVFIHTSNAGTAKKIQRFLAECMRNHKGLALASQ